MSKIHDDYAEAIRHARSKLTSYGSQVEGVPVEGIHAVIKAFVDEMADWMWYLNPRFEPQRFLEAAGIVTEGQEAPAEETPPEPVRLHARIQDMVARYDAGATIADVAREFGLPVGQQREQLVAAGTKIRKGGPAKGSRKSPCKAPPTVEELRQMVARRAEGATFTDIGKEFGYHGSTVAQHLRDAARENGGQ